MTSRIGFDREAEAIESVDPDAVLPLVSPESVGPLRRLVHRFRKNKAAMVGLAFVLLLVFVAVFGHFLTPLDPAAQDHAYINAGPSAAHWLGTDDVGHDILSRLIESTRASMEVSVLVVVLATIVALPLGLVSGYAGRWVDATIMRVMDALFVFPPLTFALTVSALLGASLVHAAIAIAIVFVPGYVRLIRAQVLAVREETYIEASRSVGVATPRMIRKHVLPNVVSPLIVQVALSFGYALLAEAGLSILGLGVSDPTSSWGTMIERAFNYILSAPWPLFPPGIALALAVLAFNLVGDGLRDSLGRQTFKVGADG